MRRSASRRAASAARRSSVSLRRRWFVDSSASVICPTSLNIALNESTSTPISSSVVFFARSAKSRPSMTWRATSVTASTGPETLRCRRSDSTAATAKLASMTPPMIGR